MQEGDLPFYLKAKSPRGLRLLMLKNNVKYSITFKYFDIQFAEGHWYAWFYLPAIKTMVNDV